MDTLGESVGRMLEGVSQLAAERQRPAQFVIGQVRSVQPLRVVCPAGELGREDLWINEALSGRLTEGGQVVLITEDQQDYYLICKAVRP